MQFIGITLSNEEAEGNGYLGLWSNIALASIAIQIARKRKWLFNRTLLWWSVIALIAFCTASVFWLWNYPPGIQYIPFIAQLRSIGRFVWITYYILLLLVFYWSYQQNKRWILALSIILPLYESSAYQNYIRNNYKELKNSFVNYPIPQEVYNYLPRSQAVLALPFYHFSNEILTFTAPNKVLEHSMLFSYRTGLPLINCMGSRISWKESIAIYDLFSTTDDKPALDKFLPSKGILCLHIASAPLREREKRLLEKSTKIAQSGQVHYYFLPLDSLKFLDFGDTLLSNRIAQFSFEEHPTSKVYKGRGALRADKNPTFIGQLRWVKKPIKVRLYVWLYWKNIRTFIPNLHIQGKGLHHCFWRYAYYRDRNWILIKTTPFTIEDTIITLYLKGESLRWQTFYLDEAFIVKED